MSFNTAKLILSSLVANPGKECVTDASRILCRGDIFKLVFDRVECFQSQGLKAHDFVVVLCGRQSSFWIDILALWVLNARPICLEHDIDPNHGQNVLALTDVEYISCFGIETPECFETLTQLPGVNFQKALAIAETPSLNDFPFSEPDELASESGFAGLIFTSGTTGLPKGIPLTHKMLMLNAISTASRLALRPHDRLMIATPFRFISSISHFIVTLISGGVFCGTEEKLMAGDLITRLADWNVTSFGGSPFHARMITNVDQTVLPQLRWLMSSGDHLPVEVIEALQSSFPGISINTVYGMAELAGRFNCLPPEHLAGNHGSVGYPISGLEVAILDEDDTMCKPNEIGALYARGLINFPGYYKNPEANKKVLSHLGFKTGDMGYYNEAGLVFLSGRSDSVFKRSGLKVSCQVITDSILSLGMFDDAIVLSQSDPMEGHVPVAYIKARDEEISKGALLRHLRKHLANNHLPKSVVYVPDIPRTGSGKVSRRKLYELVEAQTST